MSSGWTVDTLKAHHDQRFADGETAVRAALLAQKELATMALNNAERAVAKAEAAAEKRFDAVNEFRAALGDQQRTLMQRAEAELELESLKVMVEKLETRLAQFEARNRGIAGGYNIAIGVVGIIAVVLSIFLVLRK